MERPKLVAAVSAAVAAYLRQEEEERLAAASAPCPPPAGSTGLWGHSARQEAMQMRRLMQMRFGRR